MTRSSRWLVSLPLLASLLAVPLQGQQFGGAVAFAGGELIVGEANNQTLSGLVYVYRANGPEWEEVERLRITEALREPDGFGRALSAREELLLVGAPLVADGRGAVVVYGRDGGGGWVERQRLVAPPQAGEDARFGSAVAWAGATVVVGAPGAPSGGAVFLFSPDGEGAWAPDGVLEAPDGVEGLGTRVSAIPSTILASGANPRGVNAAVLAFERDEDDAWGAPFAFELQGLPENSGFGSAIAIADGRVWVGAPGMDSRIGRVFVFDRTAGSEWSLGRVLGPVVAEPNVQFGAALAADGSRGLVGAPGTDGKGAVYALERHGDGSWSSAVLVSDPGAEEGAGFGQAVAWGGTRAVVGALGVDEGQGQAVVLGEAEASWSVAARLENDPRGFPSITGEEVHCFEGQAALFECRDVNITAFLPIRAIGGTRGTRVNDVWGWTDASTGTEYVIVGRTNGTSFVDISDPYAPIYVGDLPKTEGTRTTIWRDMKVYRDHVYIVADAAGEHGVQVFDLTRLREFAGEPLTFDEDYVYDGIHSAHNIVINEETGFAYAVGNSGGGETCGGGLHMIDLDQPSRPAFAGCYQAMGTGRRGTGYAHDAQCVVYRGPDEAYRGREVCFGANETALNIGDVSDKDAPRSIATASYPSVAYAHQGWLTEDHRFFYMNDEGDEPQGLVGGTRTLVWDVTDLDDPILVKEHIAETDATDHNLYVKGDRMYQSNYSAGFRILDISDPADPVEIGYLDTSPYEGGASWSNYPFFSSGIIAVTGTGDGLFLVRDMARRNLIP